MKEHRGSADNGPETHPPVDTLAAFAEGRLDRERADQTREHLLHCRSCHAAYAEAVRYHSLWMDRPEAFGADDELIRLGDRIAAGESAGEPAREPAGNSGRASAPHPGSGHRWVIRFPAALIAGVAAALILIVALQTVPQTRDGAVVSGPSQIGAVAIIQEAIGLMGARGMVLPRTLPATGRSGPVHRSASPSGRTQLLDAVDEVFTLYEGSDSSANLAGWLVTGQVATGQLGNAWVCAQESRRRHPRDPRFPILAAVIAYRESNLPEAERFLRDALELDPINPAALFNLGFLLVELERLDEADNILRCAQSACASDPLLLTRLSGLLETCGSQPAAGSESPGVD